MAASIAFIYFCVPECKGKTLEQVDFLFQNGVALRDFGKTDAAALMESARAHDPEKAATENINFEKAASDGAVSEHQFVENERAEKGAHQ